MKKIVSIILVLVLSLSVLAACTPSIPTRSVKWDVANGEELTYDVRVVHSLEYASESGTITADASLYNEYDEKYAPDQIKPINVTGTYKTKAVYAQGSTTQQKLTTVLDIVETYYRENVPQAMIDKLTEMDMVVDINSDYVSVATYITTESICSYPGLTPISTLRNTKGIYLGKEHWAINDFTASVAFANGAYTIDFTDRMDNANSFKKTEEVKDTVEYYDNDVLYYLARSYDSDALAEAKATMSILEPTVQQGLVTLYLQQTKYKTYFNDSFTRELTVYAISDGTTPLLYYYLTTEEPPLFINGAPKISNKILKMQQGYLVFTLCDEDLKVAIDNINSAK